MSGTQPVSDGAGDVTWIVPEPKGADAATIYDVYISDGAGSGAWKRPTRMGWVNYEDTATASTPIVLTPTSTFVQLTNNKLGPITNVAHNLPEATDIWNSSTNQIDFSSLRIGDVVSIRTDIVATTTGANHDIEVIYRFGIGGTPFDLKLTEAAFKTAAPHSMVRTVNVFIGDNNIKDNPGEILVLSDTGTTDSVVVTGFFFEIISRGED